ncbi:SSI family serine proteinase inhibitor [Salininema proteolyticum]|uniref:SSI family serine proteinase inhibitor n=1 Tax=Salininema proteolyticum TaxID=1607685 RepID=A0ABV8U3A1_9ACTN
MFAKVITTLAVAAMLAASPAQAQAATGAEEAEKASVLTFELLETRTAQWAQVRLECPSGRGNHPHAEQTCYEIKRVKGDLTKLNHSFEQRCVRDDTSAVIVDVSGNWKSQNLEYHMIFANHCHLKTTGGPIFDVL